MSLDLVSRKGDPRYRPLVLPALKHLDYLTINELEASEFSGLEIRLPNGEPHVANIARAASALLDAGVRQRVVIHCPEGHGAFPVPKPGAGYRHGGYRRRRLSAASARGTPSAPACCTAATNAGR